MHKNVLRSCALLSIGALYLITPTLNAQVENQDPALAVTFKFQTVNFSGDTFTQLLGINKNNVIAGYHGSGATGHPNKGFVLTLPNHFTLETFRVRRKRRSSELTIAGTRMASTSTAKGLITGSWISAELFKQETLHPPQPTNYLA